MLGLGTAPMLMGGAKDPTDVLRLCCIEPSTKTKTASLSSSSGKITSFIDSWSSLGKVLIYSKVPHEVKVVPNWFDSSIFVERQTYTILNIDSNRWILCFYVRYKSTSLKFLIHRKVSHKKNIDFRGYYLCWSTLEKKF